MKVRIMSKESPAGIALQEICSILRKAKMEMYAKGDSIVVSHIGIDKYYYTIRNPETNEIGSLPMGKGVYPVYLKQEEYKAKETKYEQKLYEEWAKGLTPEFFEKGHTTKSMQEAKKLYYAARHLGYRQKQHKRPDGTIRLTYIKETEEV